MVKGFHAGKGVASALVLSLVLVACGGGGGSDDSAPAATPSSSAPSSASSSSTPASSSSSSEASSSSESSSSSSVSHTSVTATSWSETFAAADAATFLSAAYASQPGTSNPLYANGASLDNPERAIFNPTAGTFRLTNGRFLVGTHLTTASTSSSQGPDGSFALSGKSCTLVVETGEASGSTFQVYVNNSTSALANSPLGNANRVISTAPVANASTTYTFSVAATNNKDYLQFRADSTTVVEFKSITLNCI